MPSGFFHVGAKTWRPKPPDQQYLEAEKRRLAQEEERKRAEVQRKIATLEEVRKLEARTQALDKLALEAELRNKEHEISMREKQLAGEKQFELAKLELAKRQGQESLSEADLARIRRDRLKAELIARAAENHAVKENHRPISGVDLGPIRSPLPPHPPKLHPMPPPLAHPPPPPPPPATFPISPRPPVHVHVPPPPMPVLSHTPIPGPIHIPHTPHLHDLGLNRRPASELPIRHRRLSDSLTVAPGIVRGKWGLPGNSLRMANPPPVAGLRPRPDRVELSARRQHLLRHNEALRAEFALRAQAERLRRRRLETLDLKARQVDLKAQALRDLRKRELANRLRERGIQQREIETEVRLLVERDRNLTEAELRELRDREHRLMLKEKGLQEREIVDLVRRREERDREILREELDKLEKDLRRKELLEAELAIKRAMEKGEAPPMGITRPSIEEIENEAIYADEFWDEFEELDPRLRHEILSESGMTVEYRPRTPGGGLAPAGSLNSRLINSERLPTAKTPIFGSERTPVMRASSPGASLRVNQAQEMIRDEQMKVREENRMREEILSASRAPTPRMREEIMRSTTPRHQDERLHVRAGSTVSGATPRLRGEEMLGDSLPQHQISGRPRSQSFDRRPASAILTPRLRDESRSRDEIRESLRQESRVGLRDDFERGEAKAREAQRMREELRAREEKNRMNPELSHRLSLSTASDAFLQRTPGFRDDFDPSFDGLNRRLDVPQRSSSRASSRGLEYDALSRPLSRGGSQNVPLALPSRPHSRNLTAEDLGIQFGTPGRDKERVPAMNNSQNDELLAARLHSAALNSEINGGRRSRANSRVDVADDDLRSIRSSLITDSDQASSMTGRRSRAESRVDPAHEDWNSMQNPHSASSMGPNSIVGGRLSRANSRAERPEDHLMSMTRGQIGEELSSGLAVRSRANSRAGRPDEELLSISRGQLGPELAGRRSRAGSRTGRPEEDLLPISRGQVGAELAGGRSRAGSRAGRAEEDLLSASRGQLGAELAGRRSRAGSRAEPPNLDMARSSSRNQLGSELNSAGAVGRSRAGSFSQTVGPSSNSRLSSEYKVGLHGGSGRSPLGDELSESVLQENAIRASSSKPPSRFATPSNPLRGIPSDEISRMSTEELEMFLAGDVVDRTAFPEDSMIGLSKEEIGMMSPEQLDALLAARETEGMVNGLRNLNIGASQPRNLSRRPSRAGLGDSPPFGSEQSQTVESSISEQPRSASRVGGISGRQYGDSLSQAPNSRYQNQTGSSPGSSFSPNTSRSLYEMPDQYGTYNEQRHEAYNDGYGNMMADVGDEEDLDEGDFTITESHEHPGAEIIEHLGPVQADSKKTSSNSLGRQDGFSEKNEMHRAVKNLIAEASRRGANGVISLRVSDMPDGSYMASGEAVVLSQ